MVALLFCSIQQACNEVKKVSDWAGSCSEASQQLRDNVLKWEIC